MNVRRSELHETDEKRVKNNKLCLVDVWKTNYPLIVRYFSFFVSFPSFLHCALSFASLFHMFYSILFILYSLIIFFPFISHSINLFSFFCLVLNYTRILSDNSLISINQEAFYRLRSLRRLILHNCNLTAFPLEALRQVPWLNFM